MEGWVDLGALITPRPGIKRTTTWSIIRRPNRCTTETPCWIRNVSYRVGAQADTVRCMYVFVRGWMSVSTVCWVALRRTSKGSRQRSSRSSTLWWVDALDSSRSPRTLDELTTMTVCLSGLPSRRPSITSPQSQASSQFISHAASTLLMTPGA